MELQCNRGTSITSADVNAGGDSMLTKSPVEVGKPARKNTYERRAVDVICECYCGTRFRTVPSSQSGYFQGCDRFCSPKCAKTAPTTPPQSSESSVPPTPDAVQRWMRRRVQSYSNQHVSLIMAARVPSADLSQNTLIVGADDDDISSILHYLLLLRAKGTETSVRFIRHMAEACRDGLGDGFFRVAAAHLEKATNPRTISRLASKHPAPEPKGTASKDAVGLTVRQKHVAARSTADCQYRGQVNMGNTCYVNAILVLLSACTYLLEFLIKLPQRCPRCSDAVCPLKVIRDYLIALNTRIAVGHPLSPLTPPDLLLHAIGSTWKSQNDTDEYFVTVLGKLINEHCGDLQGRAYKEMHLFRGHFSIMQANIASKGQCPNALCRDRHRNSYAVIEGVIQLSIPSSDGRAEDVGPCCLDDLLGDYLMTPSDNYVDCNSCKVKRLVSEGRKLIEPPLVLVIHLKRFDSEMNKVDAYVRFPKFIHIGPYLPPLRGHRLGQFTAAGGIVDDSNRPEVLYELQAATVHKGPTKRSGHHLAYACKLNGGNKQWFEYDDSIVTAVAYEYVESCCVQVLQYVAVTPPAALSILRTSVEQDSREGRDGGINPPAPHLPAPAAFFDHAVDPRPAPTLAATAESGVFSSAGNVAAHDDDDDLASNDHGRRGSDKNVSRKRSATTSLSNVDESGPLQSGRKTRSRGRKKSTQKKRLVDLGDWLTDEAATDKEAAAGLLDMLHGVQTEDMQTERGSNDANC